MLQKLQTDMDDWWVSFFKLLSLQQNHHHGFAILFFSTEMNWYVLYACNQCIYLCVLFHSWKTCLEMISIVFIRKSKSMISGLRGSSRAECWGEQQTGNAYSSCVKMHVCIRGQLLPAQWGLHCDNTEHWSHLAHNTGSKSGLWTYKHVIWVIMLQSKPSQLR